MSKSLYRRLKEWILGTGTVCRFCKGPLSTILFQSEVAPYCPKDCDARQAPPQAKSPPTVVPAGWRVVWYAFAAEDMATVRAGQLPAGPGNEWYVYDRQFDPTLKRYLVKGEPLARRVVPLPPAAARPFDRVEKWFYPAGTPIKE